MVYYTTSTDNQNSGGGGFLQWGEATISFKQLGVDILGGYIEILYIPDMAVSKFTFAGLFL